MKIIPVIDILNSIAVHGKKGNREHYLPLKSILSKSINPIELANTFEELGFNDLYLADLDSILGNSTNFGIFDQIGKNSNLDLMIDAGISDLIKAQKVLETNVPQIIIGSETLKNLDFVKQSIAKFGQEKIVISVDYKKGKVVSASKSINSIDVISFVHQVVGLGVKKIILLDLGQVGTQLGVDINQIEKTLEISKIEILVAGGIKDIKEIEHLREIGISGALIATVLHNGDVTVEELLATGFL